MAPKFFALTGVDSPFDPDYRLVTSNVLSPIALFAFRFTLAVYTLVSIVFSLAWNCEVLHAGGRWFSYFTNLSFVGLCAYFWASAVQTIGYSRSLRKRGRGVAGLDEKPGYPLQRWPRILQLLHVILLTTIMVFPFIVTIVYWALLASSYTFSSPFKAWSNVTFHALNAVFALAEILLSRCNLRLANLMFLILLMACYLAVAYLTYASQKFYTYSFLDPSRGAGSLVKYYAIILAAVIVVFFIAMGLCWLRDRILSHRYSSKTRDGMTQEVKSPNSV